MANIAITRGVKAMLGHTNQLVHQGIKESIVIHFENPDWYIIESEFIQVPFTIELAKEIPNLTPSNRFYYQANILHVLSIATS